MATDLRGLQHYTPGDRAECWPWRGYIAPNGYGQFGYRNGKVWAHRMTYEDHIGPIPEGMQLDHLCGNGHQGCVNPYHLEPVTHAENQRRAAAARIGKTRKCGHPFVRGESDCTVCARERAARWRAKVKAGETRPKQIVCADCGEKADNCAKGLCRRCYTRQYKRKLAARSRAVAVPKDGDPVSDHGV